MTEADTDRGNEFGSSVVGRRRARERVPTDSRAGHGTNASVVLAIDVMSGDRGPETALAAAFDCLGANPDLELILVGDVNVIEPLTKTCPGGVSDRFCLHHAPQVVDMDEPLRQALRRKKKSSMRIAINLVKDGTAQACVSAGNTGALMATAHFVLKTLPGIDRPAIISPIPSKNGHTLMLDLGANTECKAEHLLQFAVMGSALAQATYDVTCPTIGLLNIGEEEIKGNERVKKASKLLAESNLNYIGFVEGGDIFTGDVDVVVSDGFVGNIVLKAVEGLANMIGSYIRQEFSRNIFTKLRGAVASPVLGALKRRMDPRLYNGASLVGLNGVVIKSHGGADRVSLANAITVAALEAKKQVPNRIVALLDRELAKDNNE